MEPNPTYKTVTDGEKYTIVNEGSGGRMGGVMANLREEELRITALELEDCPIGKHCVDLGNGIASICNHIGCASTSDSVDEGGPPFQELLCNHRESLGYLLIRVLAVENCPLGETNCVDCQYTRDIVIPPRQSSTRSHGCVVCGLVNK